MLEFDNLVGDFHANVGAIIAGKDKEIQRLKTIIGSRDAEIAQITSRDAQYKQDNERLEKQLASANKTKDSLRLQLAEAKARLVGSGTARPATTAANAAAAPGEDVESADDLAEGEEDARAHEAEASSRPTPPVDGTGGEAKVADGCRGQGTATNPLDVEDGSSTDGSPLRKRVKTSDTTSLLQPDKLHAKTPNSHQETRHQQTRSATADSRHLPTMANACDQPEGHLAAPPSSNMQLQPLDVQHANAFMAAGASPDPQAQPEFTLRKDLDSFIDFSALPEPVRKKVDEAMDEWVHARGSYTNRDWYPNLLKSRDDQGVKPCLHGRYYGGGGSSLWTINDEMRYACMRCSNTCRPCCIWDATQNKVGLTDVTLCGLSDVHVPVLTYMIDRHSTTGAWSEGVGEGGGDGILGKEGAARHREDEGVA